MRIIGINSGLDGGLAPISGGSVALIEDGRIRFAVAEERVSRVKYAGGYEKAFAYLFARTGLAAEDIDYFYISFYGSGLRVSPALIEFHRADLRLTDRRKLVVVPSHHDSHAASAFFLSPFDEALTIVADNEGSVLARLRSSPLKDQWCERNSYYWCWSDRFHLLARDFDAPGDVAFGKAYNKFTRYLGLGDYHNAGKTMGLAPYGDPAAFGDCALWDIDTRGRLVPRMRDTNDYRHDLPDFFKANGVSIPGPAKPSDVERRPYPDLAAFVQAQLERWMAVRCRTLLDRVPTPNICLSGGVALNSAMNGFLERELGVNVFVPPFPSDQGQALGNAIIGFLDQVRGAPPRFPDHFFLGGAFTDAECEAAIGAAPPGAGLRAEPVPDADLFDRVARLLAGGSIVAWFQGASEYGARALGNRSILADPRQAAMKDRLNLLKGREGFRPVAPAVLAEEAGRFFERPSSLLLPGMLGVTRVRRDAAASIAAGVHVDGSARAQVVSRKFNARFHALLSAFFAETGVPALINTSFNLADEPIVETPADALRTFLRSNLDALVLGNFLVTKA